MISHKKTCKATINQEINYNINEKPVNSIDNTGELLINFFREETEKQRIRDEQQQERDRLRDEQIFKLISEKKEDINLKGEILEEVKNLLKETQPNTLDNSHNHSTTNHGTYFEATNQNNLLNNLNLNYNNVISMDTFIHNMEHINKIPKCDLEAIAYASENMTEGDLADTIHKTLEKNCMEQTRGVINPADGLELIPVLPVVCSDGLSQL